MKPEPNPTPPVIPDRKPYVPPAIVHEQKLVVGAGLGTGVGPFGTGSGFDDPFDPEPTLEP